MQLFIAVWLIVSASTGPIGNVRLTEVTDRATCEQAIEEQEADVAEYVSSQLPDGTQFELVGHCDLASEQDAPNV